MDLSIIIVSFNTSQLLENCLNSIYTNTKKADLNFEVIVVDNVSTDNTREMLKSKFPMVRTILNRENVGFGRGNNQGIKAADGEFILLLNSDTIITNNAVTKLWKFAKQHPKSFIGPKLLNLDRTSQTSCGPFFTLPVAFATLLLFGDRLGLTRWSPHKTRKVDWVSGACMIGPKKLFTDGLLFDEEIFMYMEEIDLLYRGKKKGYDVYFYPHAVVIHLGGGSSVNKKKGPVLNIYRGYLYFYKKHYSKFSLSFLKFLLKFKAAIAWSVGAVFGNHDLKETYAEAYKMV